MILKSRVKIIIVDPARRSRTSSDWANWPEMENEGDGTDGDPARSSGQGRGREEREWGLRTGERASSEAIENRELAARKE